MTQKVVDGDRFEEVYVKADPASPLPVDIGNATLSVTADGVEIKNDTGNPVPVIEGLSLPEHDFIALGYTGQNLTSAVYRSGGSEGTVVATIALTYDENGNLASISKS